MFVQSTKIGQLVCELDDNKTERLHYLIACSMQNGGWGIRVSLLQAIKTGGRESLGYEASNPKYIGK